MTVVIKNAKYQASVETQWLMQSTAIKNGEEKHSHLCIPHEGSVSDSGCLFNAPLFCQGCSVWQEIELHAIQTHAEKKTPNHPHPLPLPPPSFPLLSLHGLHELGHRADLEDLGLVQ